MADEQRQTPRDVYIRVSNPAPDSRDRDGNKASYVILADSAPIYGCGSEGHPVRFVGQGHCDVVHIVPRGSVGISVPLEDREAVGRFLSKVSKGIVDLFEGANINVDFPGG